MSKEKKNLESKQRFTIKKFKIGAASVLIGTVFAVFSSTVQADESVSSLDDTLIQISNPEETENLTAVEMTETPNTIAISEASEEENSTNDLVSPEVLATTEVVNNSSDSEEIVAENSTGVLPVIEENTEVFEETNVSNNTDLLSENYEETTENSDTLASIENKKNEKATDDNLDKKNEDVAIEDNQAVASLNDSNLSQSDDNQIIAPKSEVTKSFSVEKSEVPSTSAMNRPSNEGDPIPYGTDFRSDTAAQMSVTTPREKNLDLVRLSQQIVWVDFTDDNDITNVDIVNGKKALKVGTIFEKEISPGFTVKAEVIGLTPFEATDYYKDLTGGDPAKGYNPNAVNRYRSDNGNWRLRNKPARVVLKPQDPNWSHVRLAGLSTENRLTNFGVDGGGFNVGLQLKVTAIYKGQEVPATILMADGEEAGPHETNIFTTNGSGFEEIANIKQRDSNVRYTVNSETDLSSISNAGFKPEYWANPDQVTGGLGSKVFGGVRTSKNSHSVPVVATTGATEVGIYMNTSGGQSAQLGFLLTDIGDAPGSYGYVAHAIKNTPGVTSPFLGTEKPDFDVDQSDTQGTGDEWIRDDNNDIGDEGDNQLSADGNPFVIHEAEKQEYTLSIKANRNGNDKAFVKGWIDFNNNGKFEENESSEMTEVTTDGQIDLVFQNAPQVVDTEISALGARVRIALKSEEIELPIDLATSGEVEDFLIKTIHPPKGERKETSGNQGEPQTATINFTAYGKLKTDFNSENTIDTTQAIKIVDPNGNLVTSYTKQGQGTYTVTSDGTVTFVPEASFYGTADGVVIRATDKNGQTTGWTSNTSLNGLDNINNGINGQMTMDGVYIPTVIRVTPTSNSSHTIGLQGQIQTSSIVFVIDENGSNTGLTVNFIRGASTPKAEIDNDSIILLDLSGQPTDQPVAVFDDTGKKVGTYSLDKVNNSIIFNPEKDFYGTSPSITIQAADKNGTTVTATYTPEVTKVTPTGSDVTSTGLQGQEQNGQPIFTGGASVVPMDDTVAATFEDGSTTITIVGEGTYTVTPDGVVTFTPEPTFIGVGTGVTVKRVDTNGTPATAKYTPEVTKVTPTGSDVTSTGLQGQVQTGQPIFTGGASVVPMDDTVPATFEDGSTTITIAGEGTYTVASDGVVTFTPEPTFTGTGTGVTVKRVDINGTSATAKYTPEVTKVMPTGSDVTSTGLQGQVQTGQPIFTGGASVVPMDDTVAATFEDGSTTITITGEGTYTVASDGVVTFTPEPTFTGTGTGVTVKRVDTNGTSATAKYTPEVTKVTPTGSDVTSTGLQGQVQTGTPVFTEGDPLVPMDDTIPATFEDGSTTKTIVGEGTYTVTPDGVVTFTPEPTFIGVGTGVTVKRVDTNGTPATAKYTPEVTKVTPTGSDVTSTGLQGQVQTGQPIFTGGASVVPMDDTVPATFEDGSTTITIAGEGTYTVASDGVVTFTPEPTFTGTGTGVTVKRVDINGTSATAKYTPEVTKVTPSGADVSSIGLQGQVQTGQPGFTGGSTLVPMDDTIPATFEDGSTTKTIVGEGTYTVAQDGVVTFTPELTFTGTGTGVTVKRVDVNGTSATANYTPTVTAVTPAGADVSSVGLQGQVQTGQPVFTGGAPVVPMDDTVPATFEDGSTSKTIVGEGTYTVAPDGVVTFTPEPTFTGTGTGVTVKRVDTNGTSATAKYMPTVKPVTPSGNSVTSSGLQGQVQTGQPAFMAGDPLVPMDDTVAATFEDGSTTITIAGEGTYTVASDGAVTFTPESTFTGTGTGVTVKRVDTNGTSATAKYTPTVKPVTPTSEDANSTGLQGQVQTGTPVFTAGDPLVPIDDTVPATFEDGSTSKTIAGEGTYTVAPDGAVTFTPELTFTGIGTGVTVKRIDVNGTSVTANYTPTVTAVTPTGTDVTSTGLQGQVQTSTPVFTGGASVVPMDDTVPATFEDGSTTITIAGEGTYTVASDGTVTFTPEPTFIGTGTGVTVKRQDVNGTSATAKYTPTVTAVTPTGNSVTSLGLQGQVQVGTPVFTAGDPLVPMDDTVPATFEDGSTTITIAGEGTYTVASDGTVTFTPEPTFTGTGTGVTVKRLDVNGTSATAKYTPTVTAVKPTGNSVTSLGLQGQVQAGTPVFTAGDPLVPMDDTVPATFEDGSTTITIAGEGTYTVAPDGMVTFTPEPTFTGTGTGVTVKRLDVNGTSATAKYTPKVIEVLPIGNDVISTGLQGQVQAGKPVFTAGDPLVPMDDTVPATFEDGSTTLTIPGEGTYTVAPDGTVTFTPELTFTGTGTGVTVKRLDVNGTSATAKYTPKVIEVLPIGNDVISTGL
ncbi:GEVED domain-containing protein, partial [Streptococcus zalophi]|uniref:GEVED domain-containing protein n=1 Tax=Streptococcus zalophi TaxID=640031 RepID=UPI00215B8DD2